MEILLFTIISVTPLGGQGSNTLQVEATIHFDLLDKMSHVIALIILSALHLNKRNKTPTIEAITLIMISTIRLIHFSTDDCIIKIDHY